MIKTKFLKEQKILHLTTINCKGFPHTVPVWYTYEAKKIYIGTNTRTVKAENLQKNNKVAFCVDVGIKSPNIYGVAGEGRAELILERYKVKKIAIKILSRYFETMAHKSAQDLLDDTDCVIKITINKITKWHY